MESPHNNIWGPHLWMILHSIAEKISSKNVIEEKRIWLGLLSSLRYSLPCPLCKKHYTSYYLSNPINDINDIRLWLYHLHNQINSTNDKPTFDINELEIYRNPFHFTHHYSVVLDHMKRAIRHKWCSHNDIQRTFRFLSEMKCFYDLF